MLELDPHAGADHRDREKPALDARDRHAGHRPRRRQEAGYVGHLHLQAAELHRINVVQHRPAVLAEILAVHVGTTGVMDTMPLRDSVNDCLSSPAMRSVVTSST